MKTTNVWHSSHNWRHCNSLTLRYNIQIHMQWGNVQVTHKTEKKRSNGWQLPFHKWPVYLICIFFYPYIIVMYTTHQSAIYILTNRNSVMKLFKIILCIKTTAFAYVSHVRKVCKFHSCAIMNDYFLLRQKHFVNMQMY